MAATAAASLHVRGIGHSLGSILTRTSSQNIVSNQHIISSQSIVSTSKTVRFSGVESQVRSVVTSKHGPRQDPPTDLLSKEDFCKLVRGKHGPVKIGLQVQDASLYWESPTRKVHKTSQKLTREPGISLAQVLDLYDLTAPTRFALAYILAQSMWQYYDSDWTSTLWSKHSIQFMSETDELIKCQPCFTATFFDVSNYSPEYFQELYATHRYPRILSLGTLLVQIGYGSHDPNKSRRPDNSVSTPNINFETSSAITAEDDENWPYFNAAANSYRVLYKKATMACFDGESLDVSCTWYV